MVEDSSGDGSSTSPEAHVSQAHNGLSCTSTSNTLRDSRELARSNKSDVRLLVHYAPPSSSSAPSNKSPSAPKVWWKDDTKYPSRSGRKGIRAGGGGWSLDEEDDKRKETAQVAGVAIFTLVAALALLITGAVAIAK